MAEHVVLVESSGTVQTVDGPASTDVLLIPSVTAEIVMIGIAGPQGETGPGGSNEMFVFEQDVAATTWTVAHGLGMFPNVTTVDTLGRQFEGAVTYIDNNHLTIDFAMPQTGKAFLS